MLHAYQPKLSGGFVGVVFGSFAPLHQGHLELIMRAKKQCDGGCLVISCGYDGDKGEPLMPHTKRYRYVREFFNDDPKVAVYSINDTEIHAKTYPNGWDTWLEEFNRIWNKAVENPDTTKRVWYVGDKNYYDDLRFFKEDVHLINRSDNPICATMIRNNPIKHWDQITTPFRRVFSHNILMVRRYREQWIWWLVINLFCIKLWFVAGNWSMVAMYIAWTANCIYGWVNWTKNSSIENNAVTYAD